MTVRSSGVLLHITCLFNRFGIGDLGPAAYRFADLLAESGQSTWQVLPMNPTDPGHGNSPYHSISAFAGNTLLISPELLVAQDWVSEEKIEEGFGDISIYMPYESVDVWANPGQFKLDDQLNPLGLSGVPPDYFSSTGQLWGHPVYDWKEQLQTVWMPSYHCRGSGNHNAGCQRSALAFRFAGDAGFAICLWR